jgi:hypothetical protein
MRNRTFAAAIFALLTLTAHAHATTITEVIDFTADFPAGPVNPLPVLSLAP